MEVINTDKNIHVFNGDDVAEIVNTNLRELREELPKIMAKKAIKKASDAKNVKTKTAGKKSKTKTKVSELTTEFVDEVSENIVEEAIQSVADNNELSAMLKTVEDKTSETSNTPSIDNVEDSLIETSNTPSIDNVEDSLIETSNTINTVDDIVGDNSDKSNKPVISNNVEDMIAERMEKLKKEKSTKLFTEQSEQTSNTEPTIETINIENTNNTIDEVPETAIEEQAETTTETSEAPKEPMPEQSTKNTDTEGQTKVSVEVPENSVENDDNEVTEEPIEDISSEKKSEPINLPKYLQAFTTTKQLLMFADIMVKHNMIFGVDMNNGFNMYSEIMVALDRITNNRKNVINICKANIPVYRRSLAELTDILIDKCRDDEEISSILKSLKRCMR